MSHSNLEDSKQKSFQILVKFKLYVFSEFSFKIYFESKEFPTVKIVPLFKPIKIIFYFNFFTLGKVLFGSNLVQTRLK
jgi:hypothetical protein